MHVHAKIQKWGNGLALRISGPIREIPHFQEGTEVDVEINQNGIVVQKSNADETAKLPYTEKELLKGLSPKTVHAELLAEPLLEEVE